MFASPEARRRALPLLIGGAVLILAVAIPFAWWTISPLFLSTRVDEAFPTAAPAAVRVPTAAPTAAPIAVIESTAAPTSAILPSAAPVATVAPTAEPPAPTVAPAEPVALSSGSFTRIDRLHWAEGSAVIYRLEDGRHILRLEGFTAQNGPDLWIGLAGHPMPRSGGELHDEGAGYHELERLKANQGSQNYELPADLDLGAYRSVVIYCKAFSVVFSTAELTS